MSDRPSFRPSSRPDMTITPTRLAALLATSAALIAAPLSAQEKPPAKPPAAAMDHSKMDHSKMDHGAAKAEGWKELDAYHMLMMATWHPAKDKNDLAPIRAKATEMVASAKLVAASKSPMACQ